MQDSNKQLISQIYWEYYILFQHSEVAERFPDPRIIIFLLFSLTLTLEISGSRG